MSRKPERAPGAQIPPSQITPTVKAFVGPAPIVWARYNPASGLGRIDVTKLEKAPNGMINIIIRRWGPDMGERYIWKYTPYKYYGGIDPFKPFDQGDGNWHNISQQAFLSAVGHAMRNQRSSLSYTAIAELRQETRTEESGGIFRKKVKTIVDWYAKPRWIVGGPIERGGVVGDGGGGRRDGGGGRRDGGGCHHRRSHRRHLWRRQPDLGADPVAGRCGQRPAPGQPLRRLGRPDPAGQRLLGAARHAGNPGRTEPALAEVSAQGQRIQRI